MGLEDRFLDRHREIEARILTHEVTYPDGPHLRGRLRELASPAGQLLATALELPDTNFTSWIPGIPLPALLATASRVTVDIAPPFLRQYPYNYGLSEEALIHFAREGLLLLNIRDFDPLAPEPTRRTAAQAYQPFSELIERLFDEAWNSVYFLASLRDRIFDALPSGTLAGGIRAPSLRDGFSFARADLSTVAEAAARLPRDTPGTTRAIFRMEPTNPIATYWHWAYVTSASRFLDYEMEGYILSEYTSLSAVSGKETANALDEAARRFVNFQTRLRFAHLLYSAPLSASFGGPYSYGLEDDHLFMQAAERQFRWTEATPFELDYLEDDLLDLIQDLQFGRLRPKFAKHLSGKNLESLRDLGTDLMERTEPTVYREHYRDETNRWELISYWHDQTHRHLDLRELEKQSDALLASGEPVEPQALFALADRKRRLRQDADNALRRHTQSFQTMRQPQNDERRTSSQVCFTNPKEVNLLMRALQALGFSRGNEEPPVGRAHDHWRSSVSAGKGFRDNPR